MKLNKNSSSASNSSSGQMPSQPSEASLPIAVQATLEDLRRKLNLPAVERILRETLTSQEAERIEEDLVRDRKIAEPSALQMWSHLRGCEGKQELVDLALRLDFITFGQHQRLQESLSSIGKPSRNEQKTGVKHEPPKPHWDNQRAEIWYGGEVIRKVRLSGNCEIRKILDNFQSNCWSSTIKNPFVDDGPQRLHELLRSLNRGLERIRFHSRDGGQVIYWETAELTSVGQESRILDISGGSPDSGSLAEPVNPR